MCLYLVQGITQYAGSAIQAGGGGLILLPLTWGLCRRSPVPAACTRSTARIAMQGIMQKSMSGDTVTFSSPGVSLRSI